MVNTPYPYMQASGDQLIDMLKKLVDVYTHVAVILGAMLLVLLVWLCFSELWQSQKLKRAARKTDRAVADICLTVGLRSVGSFTTSFGYVFGVSPTA